MNSKRQNRSHRIARVLCPILPTAERPVCLDESEANHLHQVLRLRNGDPVIALDGKGAEVSAQIQYREKTIWLVTGMQNPSRRLPLDAETTPLVLEVAILKGDAMSWVIEKAVELGVRRLVPLECDYGVVEIAKKGTEHFVERWQRIADQALKQCERLHQMKVDSPRSVPEALKERAPHRWVAIEPSAGFTEARPIEFLAQELHVMIGPEGGWSPAECDVFKAELKQGHLKLASLGPLVLRAETASLFVMSSALQAKIN
jgi:16S rRNA (uracil1498-N3)-methyltransferase